MTLDSALTADTAPALGAPVLVLDFDGTVAETMQQLSLLATRIVTERIHLTESQARAWYWDSIGDSITRQLERLMFDDDPLYWSMAYEFMEERKAIYSTAELYPDAVALCERAPFIVSSTNGELVSDLLLRRGLTEPTVIAGTKPLALRTLTRRYDVTFVGDAPRDGFYASVAGCRFIGVDRGWPVEWPTHLEVVDSLEDLPWPR